MRSKELQHLKIMCYASVCSALLFVILVLLNAFKVDHVIIGVLREMVTIPMMLISIILVPLFLIKSNYATGRHFYYYWTGSASSVVVVGFIFKSFMGLW